MRRPSRARVLESGSRRSAKPGIRRPSPGDVRRVLGAMERRFGRPEPTRRIDPLSELILTILSQSTSDTNRDRAFAGLSARFRDWDEAAAAPRAAIEDAIRPGGLARVKSAVIHRLLRTVRADRGALSLDVLRTWPMEEGRTYLLGLHGVGAKTAACVLLFACGHAAFPVDTHIHRIARRLGWIPGKAGADAAHPLLEAAIPPEHRFAAHVNFITLGREFCRPRRPNCASCPVRRDCRFARGGGGRRPSYIG